MWLLLLPLVGKKIPAGVLCRLCPHRDNAGDDIREVFEEIHAAEPAAARERVEQRPALRTLVAPEENFAGEPIRYRELPTRRVSTRPAVRACLRKQIMREQGAAGVANEADAQ